MNDSPPPSLPRDRRFLVSVWRQPARVPQATADDVQGMVWETDPRDPGRIAAPHVFFGLSALPGLLHDLLHLHGSANGKTPDTEEGTA